ncbi:DUF4238 domain-containing protein [Halalkalibacterium halodurans]|uniref:DUF4238 domain-containing protein n=1 Tax=Halalkalibacterium halodurans TaxID=86665 RepID=UPI002E246718|nr:DUF4238 domain-containing protein [Halalkalibacterium halodurans]
MNKQYLEKSFAELESKIGVSIQRGIDCLSMNSDFSNVEEVINLDDKEQLAFFLALQSIRTPYYREVSSNFLSFLDEVSPIFSSINNGFNDNELLFLYLNTGALERLSNYFLSNFHWMIGTIDVPEQAKLSHVRKSFVTDEFLISDNPIINFKHVINDKVSLEFGCPLSSKHILLLRDEFSPYPINESGRVSLNRNEIRIYNEYQCRFSTRKVIYNKKENLVKIKSFFNTFPRSLTHNGDSICVLT